MFKRLLVLIFVMLAMNANAAVVKWELADFQFNDGGTAYGSFLFDTGTNQLSEIDIYTTAGSMLTGRHYVATAGAWGAMPDYGVLAFTDTTSNYFTGAGWFRIDAQIDFEAQPGTIVNQWLAVGAESFCINSVCSSAANEITNPGQSRDTVSGYLVAASPVPLPASVWLLCSALLSLFGIGYVRQPIGIRHQ